MVVQNAEEFRGAKRERDSSKGDNSEGLRTAKRARGVAFGSGVLDEDDVYGIEDDYVTADGSHREDVNFEIASDEEPDDIVTARYGMALNINIYGRLLRVCKVLFPV
jgi:hypothetical protein